MFVYTPIRPHLLGASGRSVNHSLSQFVRRLIERFFRRPAAPDWVEDLDSDQRRRLVKNLRSIADPKSAVADDERREPECAISGSARP